MRRKITTKKTERGERKFQTTDWTEKGEASRRSLWDWVYKAEGRTRKPQSSEASQQTEAEVTRDSFVQKHSRYVGPYFKWIYEPQAQEGARPSESERRGDKELPKPSFEGFHEWARYDERRRLRGNFVQESIYANSLASRYQRGAALVWSLFLGSALCRLPQHSTPRTSRYISYETLVASFSYTLLPNSCTIGLRTLLQLCLALGFVSQWLSQSRSPRLPQLLLLSRRPCFAPLVPQDATSHERLYREEWCSRALHRPSLLCPTDD